MEIKIALNASASVFLLLETPDAIVFCCSLSARLHYLKRAAESSGSATALVVPVSCVAESASSA